jgi:hypothetical protein
MQEKTASATRSDGAATRDGGRRRRRGVPDCGAARAADARAGLRRSNIVERSVFFLQWF